MGGSCERNFLKPEAAFSSTTADSDRGLVLSPTQLTNGSETNLVSFVSHFQALIKIICSDCLGNLVFALPFPLLYRYNFRGIRFLCGGVQTALWRDTWWLFMKSREQSQISWQPVRWESQTLHCPLDWVPEKHLILVLRESTSLENSFDQRLRMKESLDSGYYH